MIIGKRIPIEKLLESDGGREITPSSQWLTKWIFNKSVVEGEPMWRFGLAVVLTVIVVGCGGPASTSSVKGRYPPPTKTLQGKTAADYGRTVLDQDYATCLDAANALMSLGNEGTPFLLAAVNYHRDNHQNLSVCLERCTNDVATEDLPLIAEFLDDKYIRSKTQSFPIHQAALRALAKAGPRAKPWLERIRTMKLPSFENHEQTRAEAIAAIDR